MSSEQQRISVAATCSEYSPTIHMMRGFIETQGAEDVSCSYCKNWSTEHDQCRLDIFDSQLTSLDQT
ncbi:MAG: hypothetical protein PHD88_04640 [Firmicutes bacterium]|nr:hypothetical protein [Bacillota bacterium]MDD4264393.1 hypothetical protein [Bacillota bacterium]MDD4693680.1 hypothetical protein [Bacillota bacterium]